MFKKIKEFFTGKPAEVVAEAPYKVEVAATTPAMVEASADTFKGELKSPSELVVETLVAAKKPVAKKTPAAKKPRAPKAPKAVK
jgi:hypothetical protein